MSLPTSIVRAAIPHTLSVGRQYDSNGVHVCYWIRHPGTELKLFFHSARATLSYIQRHYGRTKDAAVH